jgi:hypothetical protein
MANFINGIYLTEKSFNNGGSVINCYLSRKKFIESIMALPADEKGGVSLVISKLKQPTDKGNTHYVKEREKYTAPVAQGNHNDSDLPF